MAVLHRAHDVATHRAGFADAPVDVRGAVGGRAHRLRGRARRRALRRCRRGWPRRAGPRRRCRACPCWRRATAAPGGTPRWRAAGPSRRRGAGRGGTRGAASGGPGAAGRASALSRVSASGPSPSRGACSSGSPSTTHTPALRSVPASVRSSARPSAKRQRAWPNRGLGGLLRVGLESPTLHQVDDEGELAEVEQEVLAATARRRPARWPYAASGEGVAVLRAVKASGVKRSRDGRREVAVEALRVGLDLRELRHGRSPARRRSLPAPRRDRSPPAGRRRAGDDPA